MEAQQQEACFADHLTSVVNTVLIEYSFITALGQTKLSFVNKVI